MHQFDQMKLTQLTKLSYLTKENVIFIMFLNWHVPLYHLKHVSFSIWVPSENAKKKNVSREFPGTPGIPGIWRFISQLTLKSNGQIIKNSNRILPFSILSMMRSRTDRNLRICVKTGEGKYSKFNYLLTFLTKYIILHINRRVKTSALNMNRIHVLPFAPVFEKIDKKRFFPDKTVPGNRDPGRTRWQQVKYWSTR